MLTRAPSGYRNMAQQRKTHTPPPPPHLPGQTLALAAGDEWGELSIVVLGDPAALKRKVTQMHREKPVVIPAEAARAGVRNSTLMVP